MDGKDIKRRALKDGGASCLLRADIPHIVADQNVQVVIVKPSNAHSRSGESCALTPLSPMRRVIDVEGKGDFGGEKEKCLMHGRG